MRAAWVWALGAACIATVTLVLGAGLFPSGADVANTLYFGHLVATGHADQVPYPPLLPAIAAVLWWVGGGLPGALILVRALPALLLALTAWGGARFARAVVRPSPDGSILFLAGCANGVLWLALAWGGYSEVLSLGLALHAAADTVAPARLPRAALVGALAVTAGPYGPALVALAVVGLWLAIPATRPPRAVAGWALVPAAVGLAVYVPLARAFKGGPPPGATGSVATFTAQALEQGVHWLFPLALIVAGAVAGVRRLRPWWAMGAALVLGSLTLQAVTLVNFAGRALYPLSILVALAGASMIGATQPARSPARAVAFTVALLSLGALVPAAVADAHYYGGLGPSEKAAIQQAHGGDVLVSAPDPPTLDAWWLRALTGQAVWVAGPPWPQLLEADVERNHIANAFLHGRAGIIGPGGAWETGGCTGGGVTALLFGPFAVTPLLQAPDSTLSTQPPLSLAWRTGLLRDGVEDHAAGATRTLTQDGDGALNLTLTLPVRSLTLSFFAPPGGSWADLKATFTGFTGRLSLPPTPEATRFAVTAHGPRVAWVLDPASRWARLEGHAAGAGPLRLSVRLSLPGSAAWRPADFAATLRRAGVDRLYVRPWSAWQARLGPDPDVVPLFTDGATRVAALSPAPLGAPCVTSR
ncbi:MAG: hypothetical protein ACYDBQ_03880 [Thermoplasmatota archaeon]